MTIINFQMAQPEGLFTLQAMASVGLQEKLNGSSSCSNERRLWETIQRVYSQAEKSGAISQISSKPSRLEDGGSGLHFVLQIAEQLKDKPKDPSAKSGRYVIFQSSHSRGRRPCGKAPSVKKEDRLAEPATKLTYHTNSAARRSQQTFLRPLTRTSTSIMSSRPPTCCG